VPAADRRYPIGCVAAPAGASMEGSVGLPCAAVCRLSAGCAWRRRHSGDRFRPDIDRPAERRHPPCLGAETPAGSCRRSVRVHQPWLSAPRVSLAANLVAWHSTPNSTAPRSQTQRLLACCCARVGRSSCYCTVPAGTLRIACRPPTETIEPLRGPPAPAPPSPRECSSMLSRYSPKRPQLRSQSGLQGGSNPF